MQLLWEVVGWRVGCAVLHGVCWVSGSLQQLAHSTWCSQTRTQKRTVRHTIGWLQSILLPVLLPVPLLLSMLLPQPLPLPLPKLLQRCFHMARTAEQALQQGEGAILWGCQDLQPGC